MVGILHQGILNTKIIGHKDKYGVTVVMYPQARCVLYEMIHKWSHMFYQFLVSDDPGLFEAIHALLDAHVNPTSVVYQCDKVVSINDFLWDNFQGSAHEFWVWQDIFQVKMFDVNRQKPCPWS